MNSTASFLNSQDIRNSQNVQELITPFQRTLYTNISDNNTSKTKYDLPKINEKTNVTTWNYFLDSTNLIHQSPISSISQWDSMNAPRGGNLRPIFIDPSDDPRYTAVNTRVKLSYKKPE